MADTDTDTQIPNTADAIADLQRQLAQPPPAIPTGTPNDDTSPSWTGLLGRVLGGAPAGYQLRGGEADAAGNRALLNFGINMLLASGPHTVRPNVLSSLATGLQGAQESVGQDQRSAAALAGAQYQAAREGRQDQLARIKEAIPLLQLQVNQRAVGALPATLGGNGKPGTPPPGTSIATGGSIGVPMLDALANIESGDQNIVSRVDKDSQGKTLAQGGNPAEISQGHFQIQTATWKDFAGKAGVDIDQFPTAMSAPREVQAQVASVIPLSRFGPRTQELLRTRFGPLDTSQTVGALAGTPALTFAPGAAGPRIAAAPPPTAVAGAPVPPPPVGTQPPGTTVAMPPPVQVAGPGAGSAPSTPPPGPTTQAAASPEAPWLPGQVGPATGPLAPPEQTAPPAVPPGPAITPLPPGLDPNSREAFGILHPIVPSAEERALFNKGLTPEQQQAHDTQLQALQQQYQTARMRGDPAAMAAVQEKLVTLETATSTLRENARKLGTEREANFYEKRQAALDAAHAAEQTDRRAQAAAQQTQQNAVELARINTEFDKDKEGAKIAMRGDEQRMVKIGEAAAAAGPISSQVQQLTSVMKNLPPDGLVSSVLGSYPALTAAMKAGGVITPETADNVSAFLGLTNHLASQLRGIGSGSMSDKDLASFKTTLPQLMQTPEGRFKAAAFLQNAYDRIMREQEYTQEYFSRVDPKTGKPAHNLIGMNAMINKPADIDASGVNHGGLGPVVPEAPHYGGRSYSDMQTWIRNNVAVGHPYMGWARQYDKNGKEVEPELQLFVRDK